MDARRSQFDLGRVDAEGSNVVVLELPYSTEFGAGEQKVCEWDPKIWKI